MRNYILLLLLFLIISCGGSNSCDAIEEFYVPASLQTQASRAGFPYCSILSQAKQRDPQALRQLIRFAYKTEDNSAIDHAILFTELLIALGDDYCYEVLRKEGEEMQLLAAKIIDACIEYREPSLMVKDSLPQTFELLLGQYGLGD